MQDKEFLNLRNHVFGLDTIEMCPTSRVPIVQKITADFVLVDGINSPKINEKNNEVKIAAPVLIEI